jgi:hypothetical protein
MKGSSRTRSTPAFRLCATSVALSILTVALFARATAGQGSRGLTPDLGNCQNLQVLPGNKVFYHVYAAGVQIYRWNGTSWSFVEPRAVLSANPGITGIIGTHYAGPTWESLSGSKVIGLVEDRCTPNPDDIQWLRLRAVSSEGPGPFGDVTYIQRLNTSGGIAPTAPGTTPGELASVPYTTEYYFYREHP